MYINVIKTPCLLQKRLSKRMSLAARIDERMCEIFGDRLVGMY